mgnify:CR=1 FL=1
MSYKNGLHLITWYANIMYQTTNKSLAAAEKNSKQFKPEEKDLKSTIEEKAYFKEITKWGG